MECWILVEGLNGVCCPVSKDLEHMVMILDSWRRLYNLIKNFRSNFFHEFFFKHLRIIDNCRKIDREIDVRPRKKKTLSSMTTEVQRLKNLMQLFGTFYASPSSPSDSSQLFQMMEWQIQSVMGILDVTLNKHLLF